MKWKFAEDRGNLDKVGFKDNDIEKFGQDPAKSIVREAIQNSCDALDIHKSKTKVEVVIRKGKIAKSELPGFQNIENHIKACIQSDNDESENIEVKRHIDAFENQHYTYLEISDYNTTGMDRKSFESLTQGIFKSTKSNKGSQGSKGVGKAAYYASSYLRTMLISTRSEEGLRYRGAAKLASHKSPYTNNDLNYKGFYGDLEVKNENEVPELFRRTEKGTSIFVVGLWDLNNLNQDIIREVLRNYWFAILRDQLVVKVNKVEINKDNVRKYIENNFDDYRDYKTGEKQNPRPYLQTVLNGKEYKRNIANIGECSLWLDQNEKYNLGAVARFRKTKMLIYKEKNLDVGFSGVFLCDNDEGNVFLKEIENDAHNEWNPKINANYTTKATNTLKEIKEFIKDKYAEFAGINDQDAFYIDALDELFNFSGNRASDRSKPPKPKPKPEPDEREKKDRILSHAKFHAYRKDGKLLYKLELFSTKNKKNQKFKISIGTDSSKDYLTIINSSHGSFHKNELTVDVRRGMNIIDSIELDAPYIVAPSVTSITH
jgi:hypothetical protein